MLFYTAVALVIDESICLVSVCMIRHRTRLRRSRNMQNFDLMFFLVVVYFARVLYEILLAEY